SMLVVVIFFFFSSRRRHTRFSRDWSSDVCSSDLVLLWRFGFRLRLQLRTLDIGATLAHFHIHGLGLTGLQRGCGLALERNLLRLSPGFAVVLSQISQQLLLLVTGDSVVFAAGFQPCFNELLQQTIHGSAYVCGQLFYRYFSHTGPPLPNQAWSSNQGARAVMIS